MRKVLSCCGVRGVVLCVAFLVVFCSSALGAQTQTTLVAQQEEKQPVEESESAPDLRQEGFGGALFRTVISLVVVVGLVYAGMFGLRRFVYRRKSTGALPIRVLGSTLLGPKKGIYLVEVEDRRLVLGVTEASISFLTELKSPPPPEFQGSPLKAEKEHSGRGFRAYLDSLMKKRGSDG